VLGIQLVTVGDKATRTGGKTPRGRTSIRTISICTASASNAPRRWRNSGTSGCARSLAFASEDAAEIRKLFQQGYRGSRYSFGYPACPDLEQRAKIVDLLHPDAIGVTLSENYMLVPEQSTDALIAHHPQAKYFDV
jgi:5-methyltetrahydrofolate--homocysteine methyltransferase